MTTVLYDYWRSSASYRVRIALALKGISYTRVSVDLVKGEQNSGSFKELNPQGLVPVLNIDDVILSQSLAIIEYLDETRPNPPLLPDCPRGRAHVRALALAIACETHPTSNLKVLQRVENIAGAEARATWNRENISAGLEAFEELLNHPNFLGRFCYGSTPGLADCVLIPQLYNATRWGVGYTHLSRITAVSKATTDLVAFQEASPEVNR